MERFCEACRRPMEFADEVTPTVTDGRATLRDGEILPTWNGDRCTVRVRFGREVYVATSDCESCAEANALAQRVQQLRDRCVADRAARR